MSGILAILMLCLVCYQDFKKRTIHLFVFAALAAAFGVAKHLNDVPIFSLEIILNFSYVLILTIVVLLYFRFRFGSWDLLKKGLGSGDLVFWLIVGLYLSFDWFVIWFNASLIIALIGHYALRNFKWYGNTKKIPLAGLQAIPLVFYIILYP